MSVDALGRRYFFKKIILLPRAASIAVIRGSGGSGRARRPCLLVSTGRGSSSSPFTEVAICLWLLLARRAQYVGAHRLAFHTSALTG